MREEGENLYEDYQKNLNFIGKHLAFIQKKNSAKRQRSQNSAAKKSIFQFKENTVKGSPSKS